MFLSELTWPDVAGLSKDTPILIPIAAIEQHGHHLPVYTDSMLLTEIVRRVELAMHDEMLVTPLMWLGNSHHHMDFPGTLSTPPRVYLDLLVGLLDNLIFHGFTRLFLINGHGGNDVPGKQAVFEVRQNYRQRKDLLLLFSTYWGLGDEAVTGRPEFTQHEMGHACEWETSMILRIARNWCAVQEPRSGQTRQSISAGDSRLDYEGSYGPRPYWFAASGFGGKR